VQHSETLEDDLEVKEPEEVPWRLLCLHVVAHALGLDAHLESSRLPCERTTDDDFPAIKISLSESTSKKY
jgi:hypothetical protein